MRLINMNPKTIQVLHTVFIVLVALTLAILSRDL